MVVGLVVNVLLLIAGFWRRGLLYPAGGLLLTSIMYNYYINNTDNNYWLLFFAFVLAHLISLIKAVRENF